MLSEFHVELLLSLLFDLLLDYYNYSPGLYLKLKKKEGNDYVYSMNLCFCYFFGGFSSHIDSALRRWAVMQSAVFYISYSLRLPGIL